jgi:hypothetical protein
MDGRVSTAVCPGRLVGKGRCWKATLICQAFRRIGIDSVATLVESPALFCASTRPLCGRFHFHGHRDHFPMRSAPRTLPLEHFMNHFNLTDVVPRSGKGIVFADGTYMLQRQGFGSTLNCTFGHGHLEVHIDSSFATGELFYQSGSLAPQHSARNHTVLLRSIFCPSRCRRTRWSGSSSARASVRQGSASRLSRTCTRVRTATRVPTTSC